jgi:hypothetical protein
MSTDPIELANKLTDLARDNREDLEREIDLIPKHLLRPTLEGLAVMRAADLQRISDTFALNTRDVLGEFDDEATATHKDVRRTAVEHLEQIRARLDEVYDRGYAPDDRVQAALDQAVTNDLLFLIDYLSPDT